MVLFEALELLLGWPYAPGEVAHASQVLQLGEREPRFVRQRVYKGYRKLSRCLIEHTYGKEKHGHKPLERRCRGTQEERN